MLKRKIAKVGIFIIALAFSLLLVKPSMAVDCDNCIISTMPGEYTPLPPTSFIEEWDNGLTGNHPWIHHTYGHDPDSGYAENEIEQIGDGILFKDNIRFVQKSNYVLNQTVFNFHDTAPFAPGIPVFPETYVEFRINDLSINEITPAPPGFTTSWQYFSLNFNSGPGTDLIDIEFSDDGQWAPPGTSTGTASYKVLLGQNTRFNIYSTFQEYNIAIPEPLYLVQVVFSQNLWELDDLSTVEHHQHMEVDFLRVLDGRE
jgi:hypothetical protein